MNKGLAFFLGVITGIVLTIGVLFLYASEDTGVDKNISMFAAPGEIMNLKSFEIMQVLPNGSALAQSSDKAKSQHTFYSDPIVMFLPVEGSSYYDDQIIEVPAKKVVRQVGTFKYTSKAGLDKTIPIVKLYDK